MLRYTGWPNQMPLCWTPLAIEDGSAADCRRTSSLSEDSAAAGAALRARRGVGAAASPSNGSGQAPSSSRPPSWMLTAWAAGFWGVRTGFRWHRPGARQLPAALMNLHGLCMKGSEDAVGLLIAGQVAGCCFEKIGLRC